MVSRVAWTCRLMPAMNRHGATAENGALRDRGELRATSKKKEANCAPDIVLELWLVVTPHGGGRIFTEKKWCWCTRTMPFFISRAPNRLVLISARLFSGVSQKAGWAFGGNKGSVWRGSRSSFPDCDQIWWELWLPKWAADKTQSGLHYDLGMLVLPTK